MYVLIVEFPQSLKSSLLVTKHRLQYIQKRFLQSRDGSS
nr:MAG TPA: hypothetical protein [Caudoviricetes sp.]